MFRYDNDIHVLPHSEIRPTKRGSIVSLLLEEIPNSNFSGVILEQLVLGEVSIQEKFVSGED